LGGIDAGEFKENEILHKECLEIYTARLGADHALVAGSYINLATLYGKLGMKGFGSLWLFDW
jgi:hypothetical protein